VRWLSFSALQEEFFSQNFQSLSAGEKKINPCIGAAGVSAVPMSARVVQDFVSRHTNGELIH